MTEQWKGEEGTWRLLEPRDLEDLIRIDRMHTGRARRRLFERRLQAAARHPSDYLHGGIVRNGAMVGFVLARILRGEFGGAEPVAALDVIGVARGSEERGIGHALMAGLLAMMQERGVGQLHSQAEWTNHALLRFFHSVGFELAPRLVLERAVAEPLVEALEEV